MISRHIFLCGLVGAGKSTVGRILSSKLGCPFLDTDSVIEQQSGKSVAAIFSELGEPAFRKMESDLLAALPPTASVIALGGGSLNAPGNMDRVLHQGRLVWLQAELATHLERLRDRTEARPLLQGLSLIELSAKLEHLFAKNSPQYRSAKFAVRTDERSAETVAQEIADLMQMNQQVSL